MRTNGEIALKTENLTHHQLSQRHVRQLRAADTTRVCVRVKAVAAIRIEPPQMTENTSA